MDTQQKKIDDTDTGALKTPDPAGRSGSYYKSSSLTQGNAQTQRKTASDGDKDTDRNTVAQNTAIQESTNEVDASQQTASPSVGNLATKLLQSKNTQVTLTSQTLSLAALTSQQNARANTEEVKDGVADLDRIFNCYVPKRIAQIKISAAIEDRAEIQGENPSLAKKGKDVEICTPCWWNLNNKPRILKQKLGLNDGIENTWANSVGRKANRRPPEKSPSSPTLNEHFQRRNTRSAVLIDQSTETFPELVKRIRAGADPNIIGDRITSLRQSRNGGVIIQVRGGQDAAQIVRDEVIRTTNQSNVKTIQRRRLIEERDMDVLTTKEELAKVLAKKLGLDINEINVINLRSSFCETQTSIVLIPIKAAIEAEKIRTRVGVVYCRVRQLKRRVRCYKYLGLGHEARNCNGTKKKVKCNKYGKKGHFARECKAKREVEEFNAELAAETAKPTTNTTTNFTTRNLKNIDKKKLEEMIIEKTRNIDTGNTANDGAKVLNRTLTEILDGVAPKKKICTSRRSVYWWTPQIKKPKETNNYLRRVYTRKRRRTGEDACVIEKEALRQAKLELTRAIKKAKEDSWRELCRMVESDQWEKPYKLVMGNCIKECQFQGWTYRATRSLKTNKTPGIDGVPNEILKEVVRLRPGLDVYNKCIEQASFPKEWKVARLVLVRKGNKPLDNTSSYRPLCMLNAVGKLLDNYDNS
ncbi:hypothetical protein QTP88_000283 [Uroleucon formosanum]